MKKETYYAPEMELLELAIEAGFAASDGSVDPMAPPDGWLFD